MASASTDANSLVDPAVDARAFVYGVLTREDRREQGIFFSGEDWARSMASLVDVTQWKRFIDPSAGIGDLLLAISHQLPLEKDLAATLTAWSRVLYAVDLRSSFLEIAWARVRALAGTRHGLHGSSGTNNDSNATPKSLPIGFTVSDALTVNFELARGDCVIMNPPYQRTQAPKGSAVGSGLRTAAGLHLEHIIAQAPEGVGIIALIPDVIRSGSSYRNFRQHLARRLDIRLLQPAGHFGDSANVDVSLLVGITKDPQSGQPEIKQEQKPSKSTLTIEDVASVRVGPVVPHRTAETGERVGYLTTRNVPVGVELLAPVETATYDTRLEKAPFVVIRRTSSPRDRQRIRASVIRGTGSWLIENHLIVVTPKIHTLAECRRLQGALSDSRSNIWLNDRIRCRHLTVSAIRSLPLWRP